jgi:acetyl esterase
VDEVFNADLDGPAKLIYAANLRARPVAAVKLALAGALRDLFAAPPPADAPQPVVPEALMRDVGREEIRVPGLAGAPEVRALAYHPPATGSPPAVLVYAHGGGWCMGDPEEADLLTRKVSLLAGVVVVSIDYRLAPEHPYPAGLDDMAAMYRWVRANASTLGGDPERVAVGGDSSGGNLAAAATLRLRDEGDRPPDATLLLCPGTDFFFEEHESFRRLGPNSLIYDSAFVGFARSAYAPEGNWDDPYISPARGDLTGFGPTLVIGAGQDPAVDDNRAFAEKLRAAGNDVTLRVFDAMPHAFYFYLGMCQEEEEAHQTIAAFLRRTLATIPSTGRPSHGGSG